MAVKQYRVQIGDLKQNQLFCRLLTYDQKGLGKMNSWDTLLYANSRSMFANSRQTVFVPEWTDYTYLAYHFVLCFYSACCSI